MFERNPFVIFNNQTEIGDKFVSIIVTRISWYQDYEDKSLRAGIQWWTTPLEWK